MRRVLRSHHLRMGLLSLLVGAVSASGAVAFREALAGVQWISFGTAAEAVHDAVAALPPWRVVAVPTLGGLVIGLLVYFFLPERRPHGVADAMEAAAFGEGRMSLATGIKAASVSAISLGAGASLGREGPVVHLGAAIGGALARALKLKPAAGRTLLGCGVAAAVACSFNAPLAGALFALEVVVGHYALSAFAPVVMASVTGTVIGRLYFGPGPAFLIDLYDIASFWEFPAFILLGLTGALAAFLLMRSLPIANAVVGWLRLPVWLRPAAGGLVVGVVALKFPQILGVGYGAMDDALKEQYSWMLLMQLLVVKSFATVASLAFGFGGGVFSPALFIGAMLGGAYGIIATDVFPELSSGYGAYTLVGMGTVAAAVLGAPISTTLIVFELTGDYALTIAVMVSAVVATIIVDQTGGSFFHWQLTQRGVDVRYGRAKQLLTRLTVADAMRRAPAVAREDTPAAALRDLLADAPGGRVFVTEDDGALAGVVRLVDIKDCAFDAGAPSNPCACDLAHRDPPVLTRRDSLHTAIALMEALGEEVLPVVDNTENRRLKGYVCEKDAMMVYNAALLAEQAEAQGLTRPPRPF